METQSWSGRFDSCKKQKIALSQQTLDAVEAFEKAGKTLMMASRGSEYLGLVALADTPRAEAKEA